MVYALEMLFTSLDSHFANAQPTGFHLGNHRLGCGKKSPYEEDINIPMLMRGPDVAQAVTSNIVNSHQDMAPTVLKMLGVPIQDKHQFDGAAIAYTADELGTNDKHELVNVEFWNSGKRTWGSDSTNTYKALRLLSDEYSFMYSTWCNGDHEFYDMIKDSQQMSNRLAT